jgi:hypothetical protein
MVHFLQFSEDLYKFVTESRGLQNGRSCDSLRRLWTSQHLAVAMSTVSGHWQAPQAGKDGERWGCNAICSETCEKWKTSFWMSTLSTPNMFDSFLISCCDSWRFWSNSRSCLGSSQIYLAPVLQQQLAVRRVVPSRVVYCHDSWNRGTKVLRNTRKSGVNWAK